MRILNKNLREHQQQQKMSLKLLNVGPINEFVNKAFIWTRSSFRTRWTNTMAITPHPYSSHQYELLVKLGAGRLRSMSLNYLPFYLLRSSIEIWIIISVITLLNMSSFSILQNIIYDKVDSREMFTYQFSLQSSKIYNIVHQIIKFV